MLSIPTYCDRRTARIFNSSWIPALATLSLLSFVVPSVRQRAAAHPTNQPSATGEQSEAQTELDRRLKEAQAARSSGDPARVARADKQVIALALRELAQLRLLESAFSQSVRLYRRSLDFEDLLETHLDLAIAQVGALDTEAAITEANKALSVHPDDFRALTIMGRAHMLRKDYGGAAPFFARAASLTPSIDSLYSWATCLLASRDASQRATVPDVFQRMIQLAGDSGSLHVMFGRAYRDAGEMPAAVREFQRASALDSKTPHAHYFLGLAHLSMNEWAPTPEARAEFLLELRYYPHDYLANYMLGFMDSIERKYAEANSRLRLAAELNPDAPEPPLYLGLNAYSLGDTRAAEKDLRKAIALTADDESRAVYQIRRAYITLGRILVASGRSEEGEKCLAKSRELQNKVLELSQQEIGSHLLEGGAGAAAVVLPLSAGTERKAAPLDASSADPFEKPDVAALARSNLTPEQKGHAELQEKALRAVLAFAFNELATSEAMTGIYQSAVGNFQEAEAWDSTIAGLHRNLGAAAFRAQNYPEAIRALSQAVSASSSDAPARAMLGSAYFASDDFANAVKTISPLGERAMHDPVLGYAWAASLVRLGDLKQASQILAETEKVQLPPDTVVLVGKLWTDIGDFSHAVASFHKALSLNASVPRAHYFAGVAYTQWQRQAEAIDEFRAQLELTPDDPETKNNLGYVFIEQGKLADAESLFREVLQNHPGNGMAQYQLGKILLDRDDVRGALEQLEGAARALPDADYVHYQLQAAYRKASRIEDADRELQLYREIKSRNRQASIPRPTSSTP
jgi:tetratricopeptide (TPR) repeat protein